MDRMTKNYFRVLIRQTDRNFKLYVDIINLSYVNKYRI